MKKVFTCFIFIFIQILLTGCLFKFNPTTTFENYDEFITNKNAWIEPENYSFGCKFSKNDGKFSCSIEVTIKNGNATTLYYDDNLNKISEETFYSSLTDNFNFAFKLNISSIKDIYEYIEKYYSERAKNNNNRVIRFYTEFSKTEDYIYPDLTYEDVIYCNTATIEGQSIDIEYFVVD